MSKKEGRKRLHPAKYILVYACDKCMEERRMTSSRKTFPRVPPFTNHTQQEHPGTGPIDHFWHCGVFRPFAVYRVLWVRE